MQTVASDAHRDHHGTELDRGRLIPSWERPERAEIILAAVVAADLGPVVEPAQLDVGLVDRVHDPDYVRFLRTAWDHWVSAGFEADAAMAMAWPARRLDGPRPDDVEGRLGHHSFAADTSIVAGTWTAASASAAIAQTGAELVATGAPAAFSLCRPPGHHATTDQFGGYCYLNNAAIAAQHLLDRGADRVGVIDVDYHHGNGTQDIFYTRDDVAFCSLHADPRSQFPWFCGHDDERGAGTGEGCNRNIPLPRGTSTDLWLAALDNGVAWLDSTGIDALVVSLGVDTHRSDPISDFELVTSDYPELGRRLALCGLPTVFVMEGGYATDVLGTNVVGVLRGFLDH